MRRSEREIKDRKTIEDVMERAQVCRVGFSENDIPYIVPMNFGYRDNYLYFHCALEGKKLDIISNNPKVCFEMETDYELVKEEGNPCGWSAKYRCIIGSGTAAVIKDFQEKLTALNIIIKHYGGRWYDFSEKELEAVCIIRIEIDNVTGKQSGYLKAT